MFLDIKRPEVTDRPFVCPNTVPNRKIRAHEGERGNQLGQGNLVDLGLQRGAINEHHRGVQPKGRNDAADAAQKKSLDRNLFLKQQVAHQKAGQDKKQGDAEAPAAADQKMRLQHQQDRQAAPAVEIRNVFVRGWANRCGLNHDFY